MSLSDVIKNLRGIVLTTAIDVGHHSIKLAQIEHRRGRMNLKRVDYIQLEPESVVDNEIRNREHIVQCLQQLHDRAFPQGSSGELVSLGLNWSNGILADRMTLNAEVAGSADEGVLDEARKRPPFDEEGVHIDYTSIGNNTHGGKEYLVVAAKESVLNSWATLFKEAGFEPSIMDVDAIAVVNAFVNTSTPVQQEGMVGLITIGDRRSHISFVFNGRYLSTRLLQGGAIEGFVIKIANRTHLDKALVAKILRGEENAPDPGAYKKALQFALDDFVSLVETSLRYASQQSVTNLYLTGGGASLKEIGIVLHDKLGVEVHYLNPFDSDRIVVDMGMFSKESASQEEVNQIVPVIGMAMRTRG